MCNAFTKPKFDAANDCSDRCTHSVESGEEQFVRGEEIGDEAVVVRVDSHHCRHELRHIPSCRLMREQELESVQ